MLLNIDYKIHWKAILGFLLLGLFSVQIAQATCWVLLDKLQCYSLLQWICDGWDMFEEVVALKAFSLLFYYIGMNGFVGSILYNIEDQFISPIIGNVINKATSFFNIQIPEKIFSVLITDIANRFNILLAGIIAMIIINKCGSFLKLFDLFEWLYSLIH